MIRFTPETERAIRATADYVSADAIELGVRSNRGLAELALDANRMALNGHVAADKEVDALIKAHGWRAVLNAAARLL